MNLLIHFLAKKKSFAKSNAKQKLGVGKTVFFATNFFLSPFITRKKKSVTVNFCVEKKKFGLIDDDAKIVIDVDDTVVH